MVKPEEVELFDHLARNQRLKAWLDDKLAEDTKVLIQVTDIDQLRRAQGRAQAWQTMLTLMDKSPAAMKR